MPVRKFRGKKVSYIVIAVKLQMKPGSNICHSVLLGGGVQDQVSSVQLAQLGAIIVLPCKRMLQCRQWRVCGAGSVKAQAPSMERDRSCVNYILVSPITLNSNEPTVLLLQGNHGSHFGYEVEAVDHAVWLFW